MNRRAFFSSAIALLAALFTRKTTTLGTAKGSPPTLIVKGSADPIDPGMTIRIVREFDCRSGEIITRLDAMWGFPGQPEHQHGLLISSD